MKLFCKCGNEAEPKIVKELVYRLPPEFEETLNLYKNEVASLSGKLYDARWQRDDALRQLADSRQELANAVMRYEHILGSRLLKKEAK